ncbi:MAG: hydrogen gas-evolving membrane-bound hydrogenase subunit E [Desulfuromonadales bacterium]|nr:hydrogen gas-evolving membrane-bound hydrogenase subunit E [Desulfuromonadales bacterium]
MAQSKRHSATAPTSRRLLPWALFPGSLLAVLIVGFHSGGFPWSLRWVWVPSLGIEPSFHIDALAAQFLLLIVGIGTLVFIYAAGYLAGEPKAQRTLLFLTLFMGAMIGAVSSDHLLLLFVFWELTSVLSFLLIGFDHEQEASRKAAQQAMLITGGGGLCLLAGFILLGQLAGTYSLQTLLASAPTFLDDPRLRPALVLIFIGAFSKSAQFPLHFWLPNAMAAPTPVSAYLHSATMVKLGIYLLARLDTAFSDLLFWEYTLVGVGTLTAVMAALQTIAERDLKRILAWSTVATLGTLVMLVGLPGPGAALATSALFFAHALYKAPLFFVAGNIDHEAGTRQIDRLTGLRRYMPWTATAAMLAALSMAGLPLTFGFIAKNAVSFAKSEADVLHLVSYATVLVNGISVAVAAIAAIHIFWGRYPVSHKAQVHEAGPLLLIPPLLLVALGVLFGLSPTLIDPLLGAAAGATSPGFDKKLVNTFYETGAMLEATVTVLLLGLLLYRSWGWLHKIFGRFTVLEKFGPEAWYATSLRILPYLAAWQTRRLQHGLLPRYLLTLLAVISLPVLALLLLAEPSWSWPDPSGLSTPALGACLLIVFGALATLWVRDRLVLLLVAGLVGYGSALLFLFTGAPDLAFTQFAVETVFVVIVVTVLVKLRTMRADNDGQSEEPRLRPWALTVAAGFALLLTVLLLLVSAVPLDDSLGRYFAEQSLPAARGRNVVNVILVDFRALDTLGEIAVLAFSLLAALPLLQRIGRRRS